MRNRSEFLAALLALLFASTLAASAAEPPHYEMSIAVDYAAGSFSGELHLTYWNATGTELQEIFFRLYPNGGGIYGDASVRATEILVDGVPVFGETFVEDTVLLVRLPERLPPDGRVAVAIAFEGIAERWPGDAADSANSYGLLTKSEHALVLTAFYPILALHTQDGWALSPALDFGDALMSDASTYDVSLTVAAGITAVAGGTLLDESTADGAVTSRFSIGGARDFSVVLVDGHDCREAVVDGGTLRAWFRPEKGRAAEIALATAADAWALFSERIGRSPFSEVDLVEVPMQHAAGVEFSGLILVSANYAENPEATFFDVIVSHEMAHQWFYAGVGNDAIETPWLDEAPVTYLSYVFLDAFRGSSVANETLSQWSRAYERARHDVPYVSIASPLYAFPGSSAYSAFVYSGGALFLHSIREDIGDEAFFAALASYYAEHLGGVASPPDLFSAFETACDCDLLEIQSAFGLIP